jgi:hypothetical protein
MKFHHDSIRGRAGGEQQNGILALIRPALICMRIESCRHSECVVADVISISS